MEQDMMNLIEACSNIVHERVNGMKKRLAGKTIHVVGPRKLENDLLVSFIRKETDADCCVTNFDEIERFIGDTSQEPCRLFLIDHREPRLRETLEQALFNGTGSFLARRLISLFNSGNKEYKKERNHSGSSCGILYRCDTTTTLLNRIYRLFNHDDISEIAMPEHMETTHEVVSACPLTWRELQLLMLITEGLRNKEIASRIGISSHTVRTHLYNSFRKINARNRLEANAWIESHISMLYLLI
jgi:DNA-binding NarL/FixJ family response regulator